jgi:predicted nucleotidyltransferase
MQNEFVVLIGSVAKKQHKKDSDIDICRINSNLKLIKRESWPDGPISYVDYDGKTFKNLYLKGSLFIYHVLFEGVLLKGNEYEWRKLKNTFTVKDCYDEEIDVIIDVFNSFEDTTYCGGKYLTYFSNLFTLMKNYSIFTLANRKIFEFNKEIAYKSVLGDNFFDDLFHAYEVVERGVTLDKKNSTYKSNEFVIEVVNYIKGEINKNAEY